MKRSVVLEKEHIELVSKMVVREFSSTKTGIDLYDLYGGGFVYQDIANILGWRDHMIPGTEEDVEGPMYDEETQSRMEEIDGFIHDHFTEILEIVMQFSAQGGIKPGKYVCDDSIRIWKLKED